MGFVDNYFLFLPAVDIKRNSRYLLCNQYKNVAAYLLLWPTADTPRSANSVKLLSSSRMQQKPFWAALLVVYQDKGMKVLFQKRQTQQYWSV